MFDMIKVAYMFAVNSNKRAMLRFPFFMYNRNVFTFMPVPHICGLGLSCNSNKFSIDCWIAMFKFYAWLPDQTFYNFRALNQSFDISEQREIRRICCGSKMVKCSVGYCRFIDSSTWNYSFSLMKKRAKINSSKLQRPPYLKNNIYWGLRWRIITIVWWKLSEEFGRHRGLDIGLMECRRLLFTLTNPGNFKCWPLSHHQ